MTEEQRRKISKSLKKYNQKNKVHYNWKGDNVGYGQLHKWVRANLGKPSLCENCLTTSAKIYDWANISGEYLRDLSDWARLCRPCHKLIDNHNYNQYTVQKV